MLPLMLSSSPAFRAAVTLWRPSGPASHHRRGRSWVDCGGCDHADGTPAACFVAGRSDFIARPGGARYDIVRGAPRSWSVAPAQCQTRHPDGAWFSAGPGGRIGRWLLPLVAAAAETSGTGTGTGTGTDSDADSDSDSDSDADADAVICENGGHPTRRREP